MKIHCPICNAEKEVESDFAYRPFCSQRCKQIDLGNWLGETYRISQPMSEEDQVGVGAPTTNMNVEAGEDEEFRLN